LDESGFIHGEEAGDGGNFRGVDFDIAGPAATSRAALAKVVGAWGGHGKESEK
jgi:hypothetical protein